MTSCIVDAEAWKSARIEGSATLTMKKSEGGRNAPANKMTNAVHLRGSFLSSGFSERSTLLSMFPGLMSANCEPQPDDGERSTNYEAIVSEIRAVESGCQGLLKRLFHN